MSSADRIGAGAAGGPTGVVISLATGLIQRAIAGNKGKRFKIDGQKVTREEFNRRIPTGLPGFVTKQQRITARAAVQAPTATKPSDPGYRPDLTERKIPPLKRDTTPQRPPTSPDKMRAPPQASRRTIDLVKKWLMRAGWGAFAISTLDAAIYYWNKYFPGQPLPTEEPPPAAKPAPGSKRSQIPPQLPPEIIVNVTLPPITVQAPAPARQVEPRRESTAARSPVLTPVKITAKRVPVPAPVPAPKKQLVPAWVTQAAPLALPLLLSKNKKQARRGLTAAQDPALGFDIGLAAVPLSSGGSYLDSGPSPASKSCDCRPKRKRGPKKKRTVCYAGSYTERANGLRKTKRRKVPCQ